MTNQEESKNSQVLKNLTLEQERKIMSYPIYFQQVLRESALKGESIEKEGKRLEEDWAYMT